MGIFNNRIYKSSSSSSASSLLYHPSDDDDDDYITTQKEHLNNIHDSNIKTPTSILLFSTNKNNVKTLDDSNEYHETVFDDVDKFLYKSMLSKNTYFLQNEEEEEEEHSENDIWMKELFTPLILQQQHLKKH